MFEGIYSILEDFLGSSKQGSYNPSMIQYQFNCPRCAEENGGVPDNKYNLEVVLSKEKVAFHCWRCGETDGMQGSLSKLIKRYGGYKLYQRYKDLVKEIIDSSLFTINAFKKHDNSDATELDYVSLPRMYRKIDFSTLTDMRLIQYLQKRRIDQSLIDKFNIGYTEWDSEDVSLGNRLIIPSYDSFDDLNYWTGRDFTGRRLKTKYKNCNADRNRIIFQESHLDFDADITLVEGAIDCIYGWNSTALLSKTLQTDSALYDRLMTRENGKVYICLDADTDISETKRIYKLLNMGKLRGKIWYIRLTNYKDYGELYEKYGKGGIIWATRTARQFKEYELLY